MVCGCFVIVSQGSVKLTVKPVPLETVKHKTSWTKAQQNVLQRKCGSQRWHVRAFPSLNYLFSGWYFPVILFPPSGTTNLPSQSDSKRWCTLPKTCLGDWCHWTFRSVPFSTDICVESCLWKEPATGVTSCYRKRNSQKLTALRKDIKTSSNLESVWWFPSLFL